MVITCSTASVHTYAHDRVVDVLAELSKAAGLDVIKEPYGYTKEGFKRPDLKVGGFLENGKELLLDFTTIDPASISVLNATRRSCDYVGSAAAIAGERKRKKFQGSYDESLYEFMPLVMETGGRMDNNLKNFIQKTAEIAAKNSSHEAQAVKFAEKASYYWKQRVAVAAAKGFAESAVQNFRTIASRRNGKGGELEDPFIPWVDW